MSRMPTGRSADEATNAKAEDVMAVARARGADSSRKSALADTSQSAAASAEKLACMSSDTASAFACDASQSVVCMRSNVQGNRRVRSGRRPA